MYFTVAILAQGLLPVSTLSLIKLWLPMASQQNHMKWKQMRIKAQEQRAQRRQQATKVSTTDANAPMPTLEKSISDTRSKYTNFRTEYSEIFLSEEHKANGYASVYQHWNSVFQPRSYTSYNEFVSGGFNKYNAIESVQWFPLFKQAFECKRLNLNDWIDDLVQEQANHSQMHSSEHDVWSDKSAQDQSNRLIDSKIWWENDISHSPTWKSNVESLMFQIRLLFDCNIPNEL